MLNYVDVLRFVVHVCVRQIFVLSIPIKWYYSGLILTIGISVSFGHLRDEIFGRTHKRS